MTKSLQALGLCAICATLSLSTTTLADVEASAPYEGQRQLGIVKYAKLPTLHIDTTVPLPTPTDPPAITGASGGSNEVKGPVATPTAGLRGAFGNALVCPRGGSVSSPRQRADREIRRIIRLLD